MAFMFIDKNVLSNIGGFLDQEPEFIEAYYIIERCIAALHEKDTKVAKKLKGLKQGKLK